MGFRTAHNALLIGMMIGAVLASFGIVTWSMFWFTFMVIAVALNAIFWRDLKRMFLDAPPQVRIAIIITNGLLLLVAFSAVLATVLVSGWSALSPF